MKERLMWVLWPSFLAAGVMELFVFSLVDPADVHWMGGGDLGLSRTGVYTLAFFFFWLCWRVRARSVYPRDRHSTSRLPSPPRRPPGRRSGISPGQVSAADVGPSTARQGLNEQTALLLSSS